MKGLLIAGAAVGLTALQPGSTQSPALLHWSASHAESIGGAMYQTGRVGGCFDTRLLKTDRSYNYKLAATWLTPDVIRATVRLQQLRERFADAEALSRVEAAVRVDETVVMVEIDPREGSGVIPLDWVALLEPRSGDRVTYPIVRGRLTQELRGNAALSGVRRRNYDYERFWVTFPLVVDGASSIPNGADQVDLVVRIHDKEGRVTWPIAASIRGWLRPPGSD